MIDVPGLVLVEERDDPHGRRAACRALASFGAQLAYDGPRPIADRPGIAVSITHTRTRVLAAAGPFAALGIDLVDDADAEKLAQLAPRFLAAEAVIATTPAARTACFAAIEAGLKALGLGLLDGGVFDSGRDRRGVRVVSLDPPRLVPANLLLALAHTGSATLAVVYQPLG